MQFYSYKIFYFLFFIAFLFNACDEKSTSVFSLIEDDFTSEMKDSILFYVESDGVSIEFKGKVDLIEGECDVWLTHPVYDTIFQQDTIYKYDTVFAAESNYLIDSLIVTDTVYAIDTIFNAREIYSKTFRATDVFKIDEKFDRIKGEWIFRYQLFSLDEVQPLGSLDFKLVYNN